MSGEEREAAKEFSQNEIAFVFSLVNGRVIEAMNDGEDQSSETAIWRRGVWQKLLDWRDGVAS